MAYSPRTRRGPDGNIFRKWESFKKTCKRKDQSDIDRKGFDIWKNMPIKERHHYVLQASMVNSAYEEALLKEASKVDDEADPAMVGKFDQGHGSFMDFLINSSGDQDHA